MYRAVTEMDLTLDAVAFTSNRFIKFTASYPSAWSAGSSTTLGSAVKPSTPDTFHYVATAVSGVSPYTTGASEPDWASIAVGETIVDNEVTWTKRAGPGVASLYMRDVTIPTAGNVVSWSATQGLWVNVACLETDTILRIIAGDSDIPGATEPGFFGTGVYDRYVKSGTPNVNYKCTGMTTYAWTEE